MLVLIYYLKESRNVETNLYNKIKKEEQNLRQRLSEVKSVENRGYSIDEAENPGGNDWDMKNLFFILFYGIYFNEHFL